MATPQQIDRKTFLANLRQSGLVAEQDLVRVLPQLPETDRGRVLARALVQRGLLTKFQAERVLIGRTAGFLLGQYKVLDEIGRGGMGRVYKAEHRTMRRVVALKVLAPEVLTSERALEFFLHEVRAVARLVHPNIVTAYDANEVNGRYYLVLEYVDGPNLDQLVRKQGPLDVGQACDYVRQAAMGLQCAHHLGMVHRDIKPANILVQWRGQDGKLPGLVKISDFGLARLYTPGAPTPHSSPGTIMTKDNTVMGTPDYLSPEQSRNLHKLDIRSDLYSLGCTFYYLLTARVPFPGGNTLDKLIRHNSETPAPLSEFRRDLPAAVIDIVNRLMAKHPGDRYATPADLVTALEPFAVSGSTPWAPFMGPASAEDVLDTGSNPGPDILNSGMNLASGELSALGDTMPNDRSPTPLSPVSPPNRPRRTALWAILFGACAGLLGAGGLAAYAALHWRDVGRWLGW